MEIKTHHNLHLRLDQAAAELAKLRAIENQRRSEAGQQQPKDHDDSCTWQNEKLPTFNP